MRGFLRVPKPDAPCPLGFGCLSQAVLSPSGRLRVNQVDDRSYCPDSDGDGILDYREDVNGNGRVAAGETDPDNADSDRDGLNDGEELNRYHTDPLKSDTDGDALVDGDEVNRYHTDPLATDTDLDGLSDGDEV